MAHDCLGMYLSPVGAVGRVSHWMQAAQRRTHPSRPRHAEIGRPPDSTAVAVQRKGRYWQRVFDCLHRSVRSQRVASLRTDALNSANDATSETRLSSFALPIV